MSYFTHAEGAGGWEARRKAMLDDAMAQYGLDNFGPDGRYSGTNIAGTFRQSTGVRGPVQMQQASAQSGMPYGNALMGMASRSAAIQAGNAATQLQGFNPLARTAALAQIARTASADVGNAGVQGTMAGWNMTQQTNAANAGYQQNYNNLMADMFTRGMGNEASYGQFGASNLVDLIREYWNIRREDQQNKDRAWQEGLQSAGQMGGQIAAMAVGGPAGAAAAGGMSMMNQGAGAMNQGAYQAPGYDYRSYQSPGYRWDDYYGG
jgi:hypothetical protein